MLSPANPRRAKLSQRHTLPAHSAAMCCAARKVVPKAVRSWAPLPEAAAAGAGEPLAADDPVAVDAHRQAGGIAHHPVAVPAGGVEVARCVRLSPDLDAVRKEHQLAGIGHVDGAGVLPASARLVAQAAQLRLDGDYAVVVLRRRQKIRRGHLLGATGTADPQSLGRHGGAAVVPPARRHPVGARLARVAAPRVQRGVAAHLAVGGEHAPVVQQAAAVHAAVRAGQHRLRPGTAAVTGENLGRGMAVAVGVADVAHQGAVGKLHGGAFAGAAEHVGVPDHAVLLPGGAAGPHCDTAPGAAAADESSARWSRASRVPR